MQNKSNAVKLFIRNIKLNAKNLESWKCCDSALDECFVAQLVKKLVMDPGFRYHCNLFLSMTVNEPLTFSWQDKTDIQAYNRYS